MSDDLVKRLEALANMQIVGSNLQALLHEGATSLATMTRERDAALTKFRVTERLGAAAEARAARLETAIEDEVCSLVDAYTPIDYAQGVNDAVGIMRAALSPQAETPTMAHAVDAAVDTSASPGTRGESPAPCEGVDTFSLRRLAENAKELDKRRETENTEYADRHNAFARLGARYDDILALIPGSRRAESVGLSPGEPLITRLYAPNDPDFRLDAAPSPGEQETTDGQ